MRLVIATFAICCWSVCLAGTSAPPSEPTASPIASAKRDFEAVKSARGSVEQQSLELPKASAPELHIVSEPLPFSPVRLDAKDKDKTRDGARQHGKSDNWLLNAMKDSRTSSSRDTASATERGESSPADTADALHESRDFRGETDIKASAHEKSALPAKHAEPVANPLDGYMAAWMTPGDFQLLKSTSAASNGGALSGTMLPQTFGEQIIPPPAPRQTSSPVTGFAANAPGSNPQSLSQGNPYLPDLAIPGADAARPAGSSFQSPVTFTPPPPPVTPAFRPPTDQPNKEPTPSELLKARDDSKYFPQLKRF